MTRPTSEQIKALRKGDVVTVRAVVGRVLYDDDVTISLKGFTDIYVKPSEIMTIEPREIAVGDRVINGTWEGVVRFVDDGQIVVRFNNGVLGIRAAGELKVIP